MKPQNGLFFSPKWLPPIVVLCFFTGCTAEPASPAAAVPLAAIDAEGLQQVLEQHRGKVVLVDYWATWCAPCVEWFPHTVDLHRRLADAGLRVVTVSIDAESQRPAVEKFLTNQRATTENFISNYGVGPKAFEAFGIDDGALPHFHLYDRRGNLHRTFPSGRKPIDPGEIERAIQQLLSGGSG